MTSKKKSNSVRPVAFSAAGFKALPHDHAPTLPLEGLVVLMGTNSSGKSSLLLALRLLVMSLPHEPELERLHLRAPGLLIDRLGAWEDLVHRLHGEAEAGALAKSIAFRVAFSDGRLLHLEFEPHPTECSARQCGQPGQLTLRRTVSGTGCVFARGRPDDLWSDAWQGLADEIQEASQVERLLLEKLCCWATDAAFLDPIRSEQQSLERDMYTDSLYSSSVSTRGENAAALLALYYESFAEVEHDEDIRDSGPLKGLSWYVPEIGALPSDNDGRADGDELSCLLRCCGLSPLVVHRFGPGQPTELRTEKNRVGLPDLGDGQRQVLPALAQAFMSGQGTTLCWEHPDLHLHPGGATGLGRIAYRLAATGRNVIIETHSRDLVAGAQAEAEKVRLELESGDNTPLRRAPASLCYLQARPPDHSSLPKHHGLQDHQHHHHGMQAGSLSCEKYSLTDPHCEIPFWPGFVDADLLLRQEFRSSVGAVPMEIDEGWLRGLLAKGESESIEWKASLRWNMRPAAMTAR